MLVRPSIVSALLQATVDYCCTFRPFALLAPSAVLSRVGLLAKVARLSSAAAVVVMQQHPALWLISSKMLAPRWGGGGVGGGEGELRGSTSRGVVCKTGDIAA